MRTFVALVAVTFVSLAAASTAQAQCDAAYVESNLQGTWKVKAATATGLGGVFHGKPQVRISLASTRTIVVDDKESLRLGTDFTPEANPQGGFWCAFTIAGSSARIMYASNKWWTLEIGEHAARDKIELIKR